MDPQKRLQARQSQDIGQRWQTEFHQRCRLLAQAGRMVILDMSESVRKVRPIAGGLFACALKKGPTDFMFLASGIPFLCDAKATTEPAWAITDSTLEPHQRVLLDDWEHQHGRSYIALQTSGGSFMVPWNILRGLRKYEPNNEAVSMSGDWLEEITR